MVPKPENNSTLGRKLLQRLFESVDGSSLAMFRIAFGCILCWEVTRFFFNGWIAEFFVQPDFHFTFWAFPWVQPVPSIALYSLFLLLAISSIGILFGFYYRICAALFFLIFTYIFLLEKARYLNHFYLICLLGFLLIVVPAQRTWSFDSWKRLGRTSSVPTWALWLLRIQIGIVYVFAGVAKLNSDWLAGEPMRMWLKARSAWPRFGQFFETEEAAYLFSYGGLGFDLLIVPFLLWNRTRLFAFAVAVLFHLTNGILFNIGIFPWLMIAATTLFFPATWPKDLLCRSKFFLPSKLTLEPCVSGIGCEWVDPRSTSAFAQNEGPPARVKREPTDRPTRNLPEGSTLLLAGLGVFLAFQLALPLRHLLYPGNPSWTEEGHCFAWHMKLRSKQASVKFYVRNKATDESWEFDAGKVLTPWQEHKMASRPDMILQFCHFIRKQAAIHEGQVVEVRVHALAGLNGREPQLLIDPDTNLANRRRSIWHDEWVVPLNQPGLETANLAFQKMVASIRQNSFADGWTANR